jgi:membrane protein
MSGSLRDDGPSEPRGRARRWLAAVRNRLERSWVRDLGTRLMALDIGNWITLFGAALLLSALPLVILLSSLANERVDDDLSRHIGLDSRGARIFGGLFRHSPVHLAAPIVLGLIIAFAGTMSVASSLQIIYERIFDHEHRGWRDVLRFALWVIVLLAALIVEGVISKPVRTSAGPVVRGLVSFVAVTVFFAWTMHFLLAGREPWRRLIRPAFVTAVFWLGLAFLASAYFSSSIITDNKLYGTIGVVFSLLTWFIAIGAVVVLGALFGAWWQELLDQQV